MITNKNIFKIYFLFLFAHLILWTLIPSLTNVNLPLDTIEALAWGSDLSWGNNKHPPLSAFVVEFVHIQYFSILIFVPMDWYKKEAIAIGNLNLIGKLTIPIHAML